MEQKQEYRYTSDGVKRVFTLDFGIGGHPITMYVRPSAAETNLLFVLAEANGTLVPYDEVCARMHRSLISLRTSMTYLRRKLTEDWIIHAETHRGLMLVYISNMEDPESVQLLRTGYHDNAVRLYNAAYKRKRERERARSKKIPRTLERR